MLFPLVIVVLDRQFTLVIFFLHIFFILGSYHWPHFTWELWLSQAMELELLQDCKSLPKHSNSTVLCSHSFWWVWNILWWENQKNPHKVSNIFFYFCQFSETFVLPLSFLSVRCFGLGSWFKTLKWCSNDILLLLLVPLFFLLLVLPLLGPVLQLIKHTTLDTGFMKWMETIPTVLGYFKKDCSHTLLYNYNNL